MKKSNRFKLLGIMLLANLTFPVSGWSQTVLCNNPPSCVANSDLNVTNATGDMNSNINTNVANWFVSHGSPSIVNNSSPVGVNQRSILMWSRSNLGEGIYTCYNFRAGVTYQVCYWVVNTTPANTGWLNVVAANGMNANFFPGFPVSNNVPNTTNRQIIDVLPGNNPQWTLRTVEFTPNRDYTQLWLYPNMPNPANTPNDQYDIVVDNISVSVIPSIDLVNETIGTSFCNKELRVTGAGSSAIVNWSPSTGIISTQNEIAFVNPCITTTYTATITLPQPGCAGCGSTVTKTITVTVPPLTVSGNTNLSCGESLNLSVSPNEICPEAVYQWTGPNGLTVNTPNLFLAIPVSGTYSLTVTNPQTGCIKTHSVNVTVPTCPCSLNVDFTSQIGVGGNTVQFNAFNTTNSYILSWFWDFGDGFISTKQNPSHAYTLGGTYTVCLNVVGSNNIGQTCTTQVCKQVTVSTPPPVCAGEADFTPYILGCTVHFADLSTITQGTACQYQIDYGDGNTETGTNPWFTHNYWPGGYYNITYTLTICPESGVGTCSDVEYKTIYVPCFETFRTGETGSDTSVAVSQITLTPNPAGAAVSISVPSEYAGTVSITDMTGREVLTTSLTGNTLWNADISALASGVYMVVAKNEAGESLRTPLIKQ
jgi:PKD repeat protein